MTEKFIDLHTHSSVSDGSDSPEEVLKKAVEAGLDSVALTDHDTVGGLDTFLQTAESLPIRAISGVELSCFLGGKEIHIVGLFIDHTGRELNALLVQRREDRLRRNLDIIAKLRDSGFMITEDDVVAEAGGESAGRPHIAAALIRKGYFTETKEVFVKCLRRGAPFYCPRTILDPADAIEAVHKAGGLAVWAHPVLAANNRSAMRRLLKIMIPAGLDGMETYYSMYNLTQHAMARSIANEFGILESGGSDYHGAAHPGISVGTGSGNLRIPASILEPMRQKLKTKA